MKKNHLLALMRARNTVFTFKDVSLLWEKTDMNFTKKKLHRYLKAGKLFSVRKGIYTKDKNYDKFELATKIYTPSYITFETVLARAGVVFQHYSQIFLASYLTREITVDNQVYSYRKIKDTILTHPVGIEVKENYFIASPERAFLDVIYLNKEYHFDHLPILNWEKIFEILPIYKNNKRIEKTVENYRKQLKSNIK